MNFFGEIWNGIVVGLNWLLQAFYNLTGNYGVAIILLTVLVKLILLPLTIKQTRSMIAMQKVQPEIKKLQEKYKDDKEKLSQEMMKFYKENKVNPLGGCLPLILQLPIFFALFTVLRKYLLTPPANIVGNTYAVFTRGPGAIYAGGVPAPLEGTFYNIPFFKTANFLGVNLADPVRLANLGAVIILLGLLGVTTWYSQKQVMTDPRQKNMMIIMPLITVFIGWSLPAGVALYWLTTNALQIAQQFAMEYYDKKHPREEPKIGADKKAITDKASAKDKKEPPGKAQEGTPAKKKTAGQGPAKPAGQKQKPKPGDAARKGKDAAPAGKASPQVRKPKGPPPQQKKPPQKGSGGKGGTKKR
jgi:YidC/Oxa1 family membrane protein insertase